MEALRSQVEAWGSGEDAAKSDGGSGQRWRRCRVWWRLGAAVKTLRSLMAARGSGGGAAESGGGSDSRASFGVPWHVRNLRHRKVGKVGKVQIVTNFRPCCLLRGPLPFLTSPFFEQQQHTN